MDKIEFLQKVKALSDRGVGGEKANASKMLDKLLQKYGYTMDDITDEQKKSFTLTCGKHREFLLFGIVHKVTEATDGISYYKRGNHYTFELTNSQFVLIESMLDFYRRAFQKEINILKKAYSIKHKLYSDKESTSGPAPKMSDKERQELIAAFRMSEGLGDLEFQKRLG